MDNYSSERSPKKKYSSAIVAVIICAAIVAGAVSVAILNPEGGFDLLPSLTGSSHPNAHFSEMEYVRPDTEALIKSLDTLVEMINNGDSFTDQRSLYNKINIDYTNFLTMLNMAYIGYSADTSDEFYSEELSLLEKASVTVGNKLNLLHDTIAASSFKTNYERSYYGVGYFTDWENRLFSDEVTALMERENELIDEYREIMSDPFVNLGSQKVYIKRDLASLSESVYNHVVNAYYKKYNKLAGDVYVELVKTRLEIAEKLGKSYAEYSYKSFDRDYTPEQASKYLDLVAEKLIPVIEKIEYDESFMYNYLDPTASLYAVSYGVRNMKGTVSEAFGYMIENGLYDIGYSDLKSSSSFTTYLYDYNVPFLFASPSRDATDFFTYSHEFGHFVDAYYNFGLDTSIDAAEIPSRAMELIMPYYTNALKGYSVIDLNEYSLYSSSQIYTVQGFISSFENEVYSLKSDEVTVDKLNSIALDCANKFGLSDVASVYQYAWIDITHIFEVPFYTISYIIANDVALQILEAEISSPGKGGIDSFMRVIDRDVDLGFIEELTDSGFKSPFADGRIEKIASLFEDTFLKEDTPSEVPSEDPSQTQASVAIIQPAA